MPKPIIILFIILLSSFSLKASKDSLLSVINSRSSETERMKAMAALGFMYHLNNPDSAIYFAQQCISLSD